MRSTGSRDSLAARLRRRLGPPAPLADPPSVSVVVVSHNGAELLRTLLAGLGERTDYPHLELIVVDNGSSDDSLDLIRSARAPFPISLLANHHNESFSVANNQGAALARGELLLLLNNDIEPFEPGWLRELVLCLRRSGAGAVGATLIHPTVDAGGADEYLVQHRGLRLRNEGGTIHPVLRGWGDDPLDAELGEDAEVPVVVAACMLMERRLFERVGGLPLGYRFGCEDLDLNLELGARGLPIVCSGRSILIHRPGSTRRTIAFERARERKLRNHRLLLERWGPRLRREHDLDWLAGRWVWSDPGQGDGPAASGIEQAAALGFCLKAPGAAGREAVDALAGQLARRGHRCLTLRGTEIDDLRALDHDVVVHLASGVRFAPAPGQFNVLWIGEGDGHPSETECSRYNLVVTDSGRFAIRLREAEPATSVAVVPAGSEGLVEAVVAEVERQGFPTRIGTGPVADGRLEPEPARR